MLNKEYIDGVIVVEGKTDQDRLLSLYDTEIVTTNGSAVEDETISLIQQLSETKKVILFLDPDYAGEKIRKLITNKMINLSNVYQCFVDKKDMIKNSKKIGIAEATDDAIRNALKNMVCFSKQNSESISWDEFLSFGIDSKEKRLFLCKLLKISYCNNKQLFKRLNMLNITADKLEEMIDNA